MSGQEGLFSYKPLCLDGTNFVLWKIIMRAYLQSLGVDVWEIFEGGYHYPTSIPTDCVGKKLYENSAKEVNDIFGGLAKYKFVKFMQFSTAKEIWDNISQSYEVGTKVKSVKLQTYII